MITCCWVFGTLIFRGLGSEIVIGTDCWIETRAGTGVGTAVVIVLVWLIVGISIGEV